LTITIWQFNNLTMKTQEFQKKSNSDLQKLLKEKRELLRRVRFDLSLNKLKNVREIRKIRKEIARILTFLRNYE